MPSSHVVIPAFTIKIGGSVVSMEFMRDLAEIVVNTDLHLPGMFTVRLLDNSLKWVSDATLALGKQVEISAQSQDQGREEGEAGVLIKGEITALEPEYGDDGQATMTIRGYDKSHRLHRGKKTRTFLKKKDSDIASTIAGEAGLSANVDSTSVTFDYILQNNQTNWEFLRERARRIGYWVYVADGKLCFKKASGAGSGSEELEWKKDLIMFRPRLSAVQQADKVKVRGWDSKAKKSILSEVTPAAPSSQGGVSNAGGAAAKSAFSGTSEAIVVTEPVVTVDDAKAVAEGLGARISRDFLWAEGECMGNPRVQAGTVVTIKGTGTQFSGKYLVTSATHIYSGGVYKTQFSITGQDPNTLSRLVGVDLDAKDHMPGVATAVVTNLNDPDKLGRVKVKFDWLGDNIESDWVRLAVPMAGAQRGFMSLPEVNDEVLVAFEHGNADFPFVVGGLWNNTDKPPAGSDVVAKDGKVVQRIFKTRAGHIITLDDTDGKEQISIVDKTGNNKVVIDSKNNTITVTSDKDISFEAPKGNITIKGKNVNIESQQNTSIKATQNVSVEATSNLGLKGTAGAKLESSAAVDVKGGAAGTFDGGGMTTIKGGMVKIN
jgi:uncharacterized protein involved in type VI secretion and phage assembly